MIRIKLKQIRKMRQFTQMELSVKTGINITQICHYEVGNRLPTLCNIIKLAKALGCTIDLLVFGVDNQTEFKVGYNMALLEVRDHINKMWKEEEIRNEI